jgi:flagella basal body P-ring formation protein FlgA
MTKRFVLAALLSCTVASAACIPVIGSRILGSDLARADPHFSPLPATLAVGFTPAPGTKRVFTGLELQRLARGNGMSVDNPPDICFELQMRHVTEKDAAAAMRMSLPADASLKILELASFDVPMGPLEFPVTGLQPPAPADHGAQLWRGRVKYAGNRETAFWARVELTVTFTAVIAAKDLARDVPISVGSVRIETRTGPINREIDATRMDEVQGRIPGRALKAGSTIPLNALADAPAVRRGDSVSVEVWSGPALLRFEAIAESTARSGDLVELRNPASGKTFRARLDAGPKALVIIAAGHTL